MTKPDFGPLSLIPMKSFSLRLVRATIKMHHTKSWKIEKMNPTHDLIICLAGKGEYEIAGVSDRILLEPGEALLVPAFTRFRGWHGGGDETFLGIAQHFTLELFGEGDIIRQMSLASKARLPNWAALEQSAWHYRDSAPNVHVTLSQHHHFMVFLLEFLEAAFQGWRTDIQEDEKQDHLSMQIVLAASRLSADPLGGGVDEVLDQVSYNPDYFRRAFRDRIGHTPRKFRELKRMEFAANLLAKGMTVKAVAAELDYSDVYFFSRMFKRYLGASPSRYRERRASIGDMQTPSQ